MRALYLKVAATALTLLTAVASAGYVTSHVRNQSAPLHPSVLGGPGSVAVSSARGGRLTLTPSVRAAGVEPVTSTYAS